MKLTSIVAVVIPASLATHAAAQAPSDATCLILSNAFAQRSTDAAQKSLAQNALYFYFGRLDARFSAVQQKAALQEASKSVTAANAADLMNSCARNLALKEQALEGMSQQPPKK